MEEYLILEEGNEHCHDLRSKDSIDKKAWNKLVLASVLCLLFMVVEITGGIIAGSLAIVSDAAHLLTDFTSFMVSLLALMLASRPPTRRFSFGWYRAEILGAMSSVLLLWVLTGILVYMATERIIKDEYNIDATVMLIVAGLGVAVNLFMGLTLHQHGHGHGDESEKLVHGSHTHSHSHKSNHTHSHSHKSKDTYDSINDGEQTMKKATTHVNHGSHSHDNINVRAAFIHVLGDLIQSVGVLVAAIIIFIKPEWKIADPICTYVFSVIVLVTTLTVVRDILVVLMEGTPRSVHFVEVQNSLYKIHGVKDLHDLRIWSLSLNKMALSVHVAIDNHTDPLVVLKLAKGMIQTNYGIEEVTIQIEEYTSDMDDCKHCKDLPE